MSRVRNEGLVVGGPVDGAGEGLSAYAPTPDEVDALRRRAATALEQALGFVDRHGNALAGLRVRGVLGAEPVEDCARAIADTQLADGSFPLLGLSQAGAPGLDSAMAAGLETPLLGTLEALVALSDLGAQHHPCVEGAAGFAGSSQGVDGSWGAAGTAPEERLFVSGMLAGLLGRTRVIRPEVLEATGEFLAGMFSPDRVSGRQWEVLTAFGVFFTNVGHDQADSALQWIGRELERSHSMRVHEAVLTLRTLLHCQTLAVPGASLDPFLLLTDLLGEQGADGGFAEFAAGEDATRVEPTHDAILGTIRLCESF